MCCCPVNAGGGKSLAEQGVCSIPVTSAAFERLIWQRSSVCSVSLRDQGGTRWTHDPSLLGIISGQHTPSDAHRAAQTCVPSSAACCCLQSQRLPGPPAACGDLGAGCATGSPVIGDARDGMTEDLIGRPNKSLAPQECCALRMSLTHVQQ